MAKLVTKFKYYKPASKKNIGGLVKYIATREGVEKLYEVKENISVTKKQTEIIKDILERFPDSVQMLEYEDYIANPSAKNASEFIARALEDNAQNVLENTTYADYIATRPRVEKHGSHGLFSADDEDIILSKVSAELNTHTGNLWTMIVSLRREDAERLGYNNAYQWRDTLRKHTQELSDALKIPMSELKWYAAFHNESHHPHIHLIAYSTNAQRGYLSREGVRKMRSALGQDIFKDDLQHIYREQTERRDALKNDWKAMLDDIMERIDNGTYDNPVIEQKLILLSERLKATKSKKVYGYLQKDVKELIDSIVDKLAKDTRIAELYDLWYDKKYEILKTYTSDLPPKIPLSQNKEFKSIKNEIIREAMRIHGENGGSFSIRSQKEEQKKSEDKGGSKGGGSSHSYTHNGKQYYSQQRKPPSAVAVTSLFRNLANIFRDKIDNDDNGKSFIDKRQRREIEDKKNAEMTYT